MTREFVLELLRKYEELEEKLRHLQRREGELKDRLQAESLQRKALEREVEERETEIRRLRGRLEAELDKREAPRSQEDESDQIRQRLQKRIDGLLGDLNRIRARAEEAANNARRDERNRILAGMGQLLDSLERAIQMSDGPWKEGLEAIEDQFVNFLEEEGVELIGEVGGVMDPRKHKALEQISDPAFEKGQIVEVRRVGFLLDDGTVLRPAEVVVAR